MIIDTVGYARYLDIFSLSASLRSFDPSSRSSGAQRLPASVDHQTKCVHPSIFLAHFLGVILTECAVFHGAT